jgi:hypothetical protein
VISARRQINPVLALGWLVITRADVGAFGAEVTDGVLRPYAAQSNPEVDASTLTGKLMCGYQGWFTTPGDGSELGWTHYGRRGKFEPGSCSIDLWPDMREFDDGEKIATQFRIANGSTAYVFSSHHRQTIERHFLWMKDYGIDGVFVQRFAVETFSENNRRHANKVLLNCREAANLHGRIYAVMYDLSGLQAGQIERVIEDWKSLVDQANIGHDALDRAYLHHGGKPVVAVWGIGFNDRRKYTLAECERLLRFLKEDRRYGGCTVMVGVPTGWRTLDRDCIPDKQLHDVIQLADIVSPWTVGRYATPAGAKQHATNDVQPDLKWCEKNNKDYLPVVFPGFSWHNMRPKAPLDQIPRLGGQFLWTQLCEAKKAGCAMIYVAMFDEMNEGTAIFKCTNAPPIGASPFLSLEGLPSDHYLWLTGEGAKLLRGQIELSDEIPKR